ncbi:MAG: hypothetical protein AB7G11_17580 [Phycisphaerales bacterium]
MNIKSIVIEGYEEDITIARTDTGATASVSRFTGEGRRDHVLAEVARNDDAHVRYTKAVEVAKAVYGTDRRGRPAATNSMVHEILTEMERLASC